MGSEFLIKEALRMDKLRELLADTNVQDIAKALKEQYNDLGLQELIAQLQKA
jgi:hypothetical protein